MPWYADITAVSAIYTPAKTAEQLWVLILQLDNVVYRMSINFAMKCGVFLCAIPIWPKGGSVDLSFSCSLLKSCISGLTALSPKLELTLTWEKH